ncbi:MAG TPA: MFS transporter [Saprospiraceae bacterium]|nr:MFS transporter [Saprospiraceae bacterium]
MFQHLIPYLKNTGSRTSGLLFMINSILFSNFAVRLPEIKSYLGINNAELGIALLMSPMGVLIATPFSVLAINRLGTGRIAVFSGVWVCLSVILLAVPENFIIFCAAMLFFGLSHGALDISSNTVVSALEKRDRKVYMSSSHAFWSLGAMAGAITGGLAASTGITPFSHLVVVSVTCLLILISHSGYIYRLKDEAEAALKLIWPGFYLFILIVIGFFVFLTEGAIAEWNAIFFDEVLESPKKYLGLGYAGFTASMAFIRLLGDRIFAAWDTRKVMLIAIFTGCTGIFIYSGGYSVALCTIAMMIAGMGCALIIPLVFFHAGSSSRVSPSLGIAMVATFGYSGLMAGPPLMGFISEIFSLRTSFYFLSFCFVIIFVLALTIKKN